MAHLLLLRALDARADTYSDPVGRIQGVVLGSDDRPVAGVRVAALALRPGQGTWDEPTFAAAPPTRIPVAAAHVETAPDGTFSLSGLDPFGEYEVVVDDAVLGAAPRVRASAHPLTSLPRDVRLVLPPSHALHGFVRGLSRPTCAWIQLRGSHAREHWTRSFEWCTPWRVLDGEGKFEFSRLARGVVAASVHIAGRGTWNGYAVVGGGALELGFRDMHPAPIVRNARPESPGATGGPKVLTGTISGGVRDEKGEAVSHAVVAAWHSSPTPVALPEGSGGLRYAVSDASGRFLLRGTPPGTRWLLKAYAPTAQTSLMERLDVVVPQQGTLAVDVPARSILRVTGRVLLEDGRPVPGVQVDAVGMNGTSAPPPRYAVPVGRAVTDHDGRFAMAFTGSRLQIMDPGLIQLDRADGGFIASGLAGGGVVIRARRVPRATWEGRVTDIHGTPLAWQAVWLGVRVPWRRSMDLPTLGCDAFALTDGDGRFVIALQQGPRIPDAQHELHIGGRSVDEVRFEGEKGLQVRVAPGR